MKKEKTAFFAPCLRSPREPNRQGLHSSHGLPRGHEDPKLHEGPGARLQKFSHSSRSQWRRADGKMYKQSAL